MSKITAKQAGHKNVPAFLDMIAHAEGTSTSRYSKDDGYDIVVFGKNSPRTFSDYSKHPNVLVTVRDEVRSPATGQVVTKALKSTAAGRYQILKRYADAYTTTLKLPDFGPLSQDAIAIRMLKEQGAMPLIEAGDFAGAVKKVSNIWASLPGDVYGQRGVHSPKLAELEAVYRKAGGSLSTDPVQRVAKAGKEDTEEGTC